jgi:hypothetical protein
MMELYFNAILIRVKTAKHRPMTLMAGTIEFSYLCINQTQVLVTMS